MGYFSMGDLSTMSYNIWNTLKDLFTGNLEFVDASTKTDRLTICQSCEARDNNFCTVCGCYLPAKTKLKKSECPMELW